MTGMTNAKIIKSKDKILLNDVSDFDLFKIMLDFQGNDYPLYEAQCMLENAHHNECEIFPGIYFKRNKNDIFRRIYCKLKGLRNFEIVIENHKDHFDVRKGHRKTDEFHEEVVSYMQLENIRPTDVEWPVNLGSGKCRGCNVYDFFEMLRLTDTSYYGFCSERGIVAHTKGEPYFDDLCKCNKCYEYYTDIVNNGYKVRVYDGKEDHIEVSIINNDLYASEGKHRICCLKRFEYDGKVPALVSRIRRTGTHEPLYIPSFERYTEERMNLVKEEFYTTCDRLGIGKEEAREALKNGDNVVGLLKRSKYSFEELYRNSKEELNKQLTEAFGTTYKEMGL